MFYLHTSVIDKTADRLGVLKSHLNNIGIEIDLAKMKIEPFSCFGGNDNQIFRGTDDHPIII